MRGERRGQRASVDAVHKMFRSGQALNLRPRASQTSRPKNKRKLRMHTRWDLMCTALHRGSRSLWLCAEYCRKTGCGASSFGYNYSPWHPNQGHVQVYNRIHIAIVYNVLDRG